ncbi:MAG: DUF4258 domain-containing protein [Acidiferrobacteraceae bacterium]|nr:DUF4258 domain-containing protein [Acidiferrobacteraceae bacterium]
MGPILFSEHARVRCAQRGIDESLICMVLAYGRAKYDHHGGWLCFLGQTEKRRVAREHPDMMRRYGRKLDLVVVMPAKGEQTVVTAYVRPRGR